MNFRFSGNTATSLAKPLIKGKETGSFTNLKDCFNLQNGGIYYSKFAKDHSYVNPIQK